MSQSTEPQEALTAFTAFRAGGRLLATHPELAQSTNLRWFPHHDGRLGVDVHLMDPEGCELLPVFAAALGFELHVSRWTSTKFGPVVGLRVGGEFDGAQWDVWAQVSAQAYADYLAAQHSAVAA